MSKVQKKQIKNKISPSWVIFLDLFKGEKCKWNLPNLSDDADYKLKLLQIAIIHPDFVNYIGVDKIRKYLYVNRELLENYPLLFNFPKLRMIDIPKDEIAPLVYKGGDITFLADSGYARYVVMTQQKKVLEINGRNFIEIWRDVDKKCTNPERLYNFLRGIDPAAAEKSYFSYIENGFFYPLCLFTSEITLNMVWSALDGLETMKEKTDFVDFMYDFRFKLMPDLMEQLRCDKNFKSFIDFRKKSKNPLWGAFTPSEEFYRDMDKWHTCGCKKKGHDISICRFCSPKLSDFNNLRKEETRRDLLNITLDQIYSLGKTKKTIVFRSYKIFPELFEGLSPAFKIFFNEKEKSARKFHLERINYDSDLNEENHTPHPTKKNIEWDLDLERKSSPEPQEKERIRGFPAAWLS